MAKKLQVVLLQKAQYNKIRKMVEWQQATPDRIELPDHIHDFIRDTLADILAPHIGEECFGEAWIYRGELRITKLIDDEREPSGFKEQWVRVLPQGPGR